MTHSARALLFAVLVRSVRASLRARDASFSAPVVQTAMALIADLALTRLISLRE